MLFRRKIYDKFLAWKNETNGEKALLVEGARRIGKSTIVEEFGKNEYKSYLLIDFATATDEVKNYFRLHLNDLDTLYMLLSVHYGKQLYPRESLIIFDEVQMFPKAREAIKYLVADGRYDFIETGSLISIKENVKDIVIPSEVIKEFNVDLATPSNLINSFNFIREVIVWTFITEDYKNKVYKVSMRSHGPVINKTASKYNGGGHKYASGARLNSEDEINNFINDLDTLCEEYKRAEISNI